MRRIILLLGVAALLAASGTVQAGNGGKSGKTADPKSKATASKKPGAKAGAATPRSNGPASAPRAEERRFQRKYAARPGAAQTMKNGQQARTKRQNLRGAGVRGEVDRAVQPNRATLQHRGDKARMVRQRGRVQGALGRAGAPATRGQTVRTGTPTGTGTVATPRNATSTKGPRGTAATGKRTPRGAKPAEQAERKATRPAGAKKPAKRKDG